MISNEDGSGTILLLAVCGLTLGLTAILLGQAQNAAAQQAASFAAQAAAIGAANAENGYLTGFPCEVASKIAGEDMAKLVWCRIVSNQVNIRAEVKSLGMVHFADARGFNPGVTDIREH